MDDLMPSDAFSSIVGNATRDPELRFTNAGMAIASFGVAVNHRFQRNNEWQEEVSFFDVTAFGSLAENAAESIAKGQRVHVAGRLQQRSWETQDGQKRSKVEIVADDVAISLKWGVTEYTRTAGQDGRSSGGGQRSSGGGGRRAPANEPAPVEDFNYDEEPF